MYQKFSFIFILLFSVCCASFRVTAQSALDTSNEQKIEYNSHTPNAGQWQTVTEDKAFGYRNATEEGIKPQNDDDNKPGLFGKALSAIIEFLASTVGQYMIWGLVVLIVLYGVYKLVISNGSFLFGKNSKKLSGTEETVSEEEELMSANWEHRLQQAIAAGDFRMAVRYSYMYLLKIMQDRQLIDYRQDKTNYEYAHELEDTKYKQPFRKLTRQYEYAWYGQYPLSQASFTEYLKEFQDLKKQIGAS
ncbi:hypothetical protein DN068_15705 [Taibaiella soli]|uniref:Protein-glutamine gamma-glutamyltransferase-like C-terminal domain-containing protein n=2 Tax=Taibaiella soli TaxID=1649169 RepID=A0A2W2BVU7_9BACT|nr:hypothetical protein DN068_15705 [Taibaiella soli]